jgi:hypothetical protein
MQTSLPKRGKSQRLTGTGFANEIQATAGRCRQLLIKARDANAGIGTSGHAANSDSVVIFIGEEGTNEVTHSGYTLQPGEAVTVAVDDSSMIYMRAATGDSVNIIILE